MLQLLTPTGGRPVQWALCQRWAMAQSYAGPVRWIVVDDCEPAQRITVERAQWSVAVLRPAPFWTSGENTQARNLLAGLDACDPDHPIIFWEDDDYYGPDWLETVARMLEQAELVGEGPIHYYNVATRRWVLTPSNAHALSSSAIRGEAVRTFRQIVTTHNVYLDAELWKAHTASQLAFPGHRVVSLKGMPGRPGIGRGHLQRFGSQRDQDGRKLTELLGEAAEVYLRFYAPARVAAA